MPPTTRMKYTFHRELLLLIHSITDNKSQTNYLEQTKINNSPTKIRLVIVFWSNKAKELTKDTKKGLTEGTNPWYIISCRHEAMYFHLTSIISRMK